MSQSLPDAESIRRAAREVLEQSDYDLTPPEQSSWLSDWMTVLFDKILFAFGWIRSQLDLLPNWLQWGLLLVLIAIVIGGLRKVYRQWQRTRRVYAPLHTDSLATTASPDELDRLADEAAQREDFVNAARLHLRGAVLRIENAEQRINRPGTTNIELLRRYRGTRLAEHLGVLVGFVNLKWYGGRDCTRDEYDRCRESAAAIRQNPRSTPVAKRAISR